MTDELRGISGDNPTLSPQTRRVAELLRLPGVMDRWRRQCEESQAQSRQRTIELNEWEQRRQEYALGLPRDLQRAKLDPPAEGWTWSRQRVLSPDDATWLAEGWFPPEFNIDKKPFNAPVISFSPAHPMTIADCYFALAVVHDGERQGMRKIESLADDVIAGCSFLAQTKWVSKLSESHRLDLDDCLARVESDLQESRLIRLGRSTQTDGNPPKFLKPSTGRGGGEYKLIAALTTHHQYAKGSCLNLEPIGNNELARLAKVGTATATRFLRRWFGGHSKYRGFCLRNTSKVIDTIKAMNGEFVPLNEPNYGAVPPFENELD